MQPANVSTMANNTSLSNHPKGSTNQAVQKRKRKKNNNQLKRT